VRTLPVACDPSAFISREAFAAHLAEGRRLLSLARERRELPDGWVLRLPGDVWMRITGPEGAKDVLRAELGEGWRTESRGATSKSR
jgi:hypothetical protein